MKKNDFWSIGMLTMVLTFSFAAAGCESAPKESPVSLSEPNLEETLRRYMAPQPETWGDDRSRFNVDVYYLDPLQFEKFRAELKAGGEYQETDSRTAEDRDWNRGKTFARLAVRSDGSFELELFNEDNSRSAYRYEKTASNGSRAAIGPRLDASLRKYMVPQLQDWDGEAVTVYPLDPLRFEEFKVELEALGYYIEDNNNFTRNWDQGKTFARWADRSDGRLELTLANADNSTFEYRYTKIPPPLVSIDNWNGSTGIIEVGVPALLVGRPSVTGAIWWWIADQRTLAERVKETFDWSVKDAGGTGATITGDIIHATAPGIVIVTASVSNGMADGKPAARDFRILVLGPKVTKGDYVVREFKAGWLLDKYSGKEKNVAIPVSLGITAIGGGGHEAFTGSQIASIIIPEGVTEIFGGAFSGCSNLQSITFPSTLRLIANNSFSGCVRLESITIPYGVTTIENWAFYNCEKLTSVTIPASVTTMGGGVFAKCSGLTSITIQAVQPPRIVHLWDQDDTKNLTGIYVPAASVNAYKSAEVWKDDRYRNFIKPIE